MLDLHPFQPALGKVTGDAGEADHRARAGLRGSEAVQLGPHVEGPGLHPDIHYP